jgi:hypothetical protein
MGALSGAYNFKNLASTLDATQHLLVVLGALSHIWERSHGEVKTPRENTYR